MRQGPDLLQSLIKYFQAQLRSVPNLFSPLFFPSLLFTQFYLNILTKLLWSDFFFTSYYYCCLPVKSDRFPVWAVFTVQASDVLVCSDLAVECHSDSANAGFFSGSVSFRMDWKRLRISLPLSRSWLHLFIRWVPRSWWFADYLPSDSLFM